MPVTHYQSSSGPKVIATMNYHNLKAAHAKLEREGTSDRRPEIDAMAERLAVLDAEHAATEGAKGDEGAASVAAPAPIGHNEPPADSPFEAIKVHIDDLYAEAKNWLDGEPITTQGQADAVSKLLGMIKEAERAADDARKTENEPFDRGKAEVQARYAALISDTKSVRGKTVLAAEACKKALTPWLRKLDEEREAEAKRKREEADALAAKAREALKSDNLETVEQAEAIFANAKSAEREAKAIEGDRARVGVGSGFKATILRDNWIPSLTDGTVALRHYWQTRRPELEAFALRLAAEDVRAGVRTIPGFDVINDRRAA